MLTETQARELLAKAATTVDVGPPLPFPEQPRGRPIVPLLAAAAVLLVAGGIAIARQGSADRPAPAAPTYPTYPGDPTFHLGPDQVPPLEGYTQAEATRLLAQRGYAVTAHAEASCALPEGTVMAVSPPPGTIARSGQRVDLTVAADSGDCRGRAAASDPLLSWAEGEGAVPQLAQRVVVESDGRVLATLVGAARTDPRAWPGLDAFVEAATGASVEPPGDGGESYRVVANQVVVYQGSRSCRGPSDACPARSVEVHIGHQDPPRLDIMVDAVGDIEAVNITDHRSTAGELPDVVGDSAAYATARLQAFGYAVTQVPRADCAPVGRVTRVSVVDSRALIGVTRRTGACDQAPLRAW